MESEEGRGSSFSVTIPVARCPAHMASRCQSLARSASREALEQAKAMAALSMTDTPKSVARAPPGLEMQHGATLRRGAGYSAPVAHGGVCVCARL